LLLLLMLMCEMFFSECDASAMCSVQSVRFGESCTRGKSAVECAFIYAQPTKATARQSNTDQGSMR
jgi:hypothetical protein